MLWKVVEEPCPWVDRVLRDEAVIRGLDDGEARLLLDWLAEVAAELWHSPRRRTAEAAFEQALRRCRGIKRFIALWFQESNPGAAAQLAEAEGFQWPLPRPDETDPVAVLERILSCEKPTLEAPAVRAPRRRQAA